MAQLSQWDGGWTQSPHLISMTKVVEYGAHYLQHMVVREANWGSVHFIFGLVFYAQNG